MQRAYYICSDTPYRGLVRPNRVDTGRVVPKPNKTAPPTTPPGRRRGGRAAVFLLAVAARSAIGSDIADQNRAMDGATDRAGPLDGDIVEMLCAMRRRRATVCIPDDTTT
jgi:hypothetical protein